MTWHIFDYAVAGSILFTAFYTAYLTPVIYRAVKKDAPELSYLALIICVVATLGFLNTGLSYVVDVQARAEVVE